MLPARRLAFLAALAVFCMLVIGVHNTEGAALNQSTPTIGIVTVTPLPTVQPVGSQLVIGIGNAAQVKLSKRLGRGHVIGSAWRDAQTLLVASELGLWEYHVGGQEGPFHPFSNYPGRTEVAEYSPDRTLVAINSDDDIQLWEVATGNKRATLKTGNPASQNTVQMAFDPAGRLAVYYGDGMIRLWNVQNGAFALLATFNGDYDWANNHLLFSPDGKLIVTVGKTLSVWEVATGQQHILLNSSLNPKLNMSTPELDVDQVFISPDGKTLITNARSDQSLWQWDIASGQKRSLSDQSLSDLALSPDGKLLVGVTKQHQIQVLQVATGQLQMTLSGHGTYLYELAFSPDGSLLIVVSDAEIDVWDVGTGRLLPTLPYQTELFFQRLLLGFSPDSIHLAFLAVFNDVKIVDLISAAAWSFPHGHDGPVFKVAFNPGAQTLTSVAIEDEQANLWNLRTGTRQNVIQTYFDVNTFFSADGTIAAFQNINGAEMKVYNLVTGKQLLKAHGNDEGLIGLAANGVILVYQGTDQNFHVYNLSIGREILNLAGTSAELSPDGSLLAVVNQGHLELWDTATAAKRSEAFAGQIDSILAISPDGRALALRNTAGDKVFVVGIGPNFSLDTIDVIAVPPISNIYVEFSADHSLITISITLQSSGVYQAIYQVLPEQAGTLGPVAGDAEIALSPIGKTFVVGSYGDAKNPGVQTLWDVTTNQAVGVVSDDCCASAYSPDGSLLAVGSKDGSIQLVESATGKRLATLSGVHHGSIFSLAFSPDGTMLASGGADRTIGIWTVQ